MFKSNALLNRKAYFKNESIESNYIFFERVIRSLKQAEKIGQVRLFFHFYWDEVRIWSLISYPTFGQYVNTHQQILESEKKAFSWYGLRKPVTSF
jgi:hypothetical protein